MYEGGEQQDGKCDRSQTINGVVKHWTTPAKVEEGGGTRRLLFLRFVIARSEATKQSSLLLWIASLRSQ
jgi:hypothetical protein